MKLSKHQLKQIIKEELDTVVRESFGSTPDDPSVAAELEAERRREQDRRAALDSSSQLTDEEVEYEYDEVIDAAGSMIVDELPYEMILDMIMSEAPNEEKASQIINYVLAMLREEGDTYYVSEFIDSMPDETRQKYKK
jgi:hypothetical protein|tara:strand:+ start:1656 stop:2069 length:414 start_codon:yes stop_codon:yes gene_type:complete